jgi:hypothetical protein
MKSFARIFAASVFLFRDQDAKNSQVPFFEQYAPETSALFRKVTVLVSYSKACTIMIYHR